MPKLWHDGMTTNLREPLAGRTIIIGLPPTLAMCGRTAMLSSVRRHFWPTTGAIGIVRMFPARSNTKLKNTSGRSRGASPSGRLGQAVSPRYPRHPRQQRVKRTRKSGSTQPCSISDHKSESDRLELHKSGARTTSPTTRLNPWIFMADSRTDLAASSVRARMALSRQTN